MVTANQFVTQHKWRWHHFEVFGQQDSGKECQFLILEVEMDQDEDEDVLDLKLGHFG